MKPDFEKKLKEKELVGAVAALYPIGHYYKVSLIELLESAYLEGRKAQIEIDCEIAKGIDMDCSKFHSINGYFVEGNGIVRNVAGEYLGRLTDLEEFDAIKKQLAEKDDEITFLKALSSAQINTIKVMEKLKRRAIKTAAYEAIKKQLKEKDELLETMREALEESELFNRVVRPILVKGSPALKKCNQVVRKAKEALALLKKTMPKKGSEE